MAVNNAVAREGDPIYKAEARYADKIETHKKKGSKKEPKKEPTREEIVSRMKNAISKLK